MQSVEEQRGIVEPMSEDILKYTINGQFVFSTLLVLSLGAIPGSAQCFLNGSPNPCVLAGPLTINSYNDGTGNTTNTSGALTNNGTMSVIGALQLVDNTSLTGPGTLTLSTGQIGTDSNGYTLTTSSTIQGSGVIGSNAATYQNLNLNNTGTINANSSANTLFIQGTGSVINGGTFEATAGANLTLATAAAINNGTGLIISNGNGSVVNVNTALQGGTLGTANGGILQTGSAAMLDALSQGAITLRDGSTYTAGAAGTGTITSVTGTLKLGTATGGTLALGGALQLTGNTTLATSTGTVNMTSGQIGTDSNGYTLTNNGLIQGTGVIGSNATTYGNLGLTNAGTISANASGGVLSVQGTGSSIVNAGTLQAAGGTLTLTTVNAIDNNGGLISSTGSGSIINVNTSIQGGTLSTSGGAVLQTAGGATLDGLSQGAITLRGGSTYTAGAAGTGTVTNVIGTLNLGTMSGATLSLGGALQLVGDTTLGAAAGTVTMVNGQIGTNSNGYTLTNDGTIQGSGVIGSNATTYQNLNLNNTNLIDGNSGTLSVQGTGSVVNAGTLEASAGATLNLATSNPLDNSAGLILATGSGSTVNVSTTIQGGTFYGLNGGILQTSGGATLDGSTHGAISFSDGSTYKAGAAGSATVTNVNGTLNLGTASGATLALGGALELVGNTTLPSGAGTVTMVNGQIGTNGNGYTLTNNGLIQGSGIVGSNNTTYGNLNLTNTGTINANSSASALNIQGTGTIVNSGLFEATGGATLNVAGANPVQNSGTISSIGAGSTVNLSGTIQGGTLSTSGGGIMQTNGGVTLDGQSPGAITLASGSNYLAAGGTLTNTTGQLIFGTGSTLQLNSNNGDALLRLVGNTTLSGPGSLTLIGGQVGTDGNGYTLTNNATIQGYGLIGSNEGADYRNINVINGGTILANAAGQTLTVAGTSLTNSGTLQANSGSTLHSTSAFTNFSGGTLTGGTYAAYAGPASATVQIDALGSGGGEIANNAATIVLSGTDSALTDASNMDALANLSANLAGGSLSVLSGRTFNTLSAFDNEGILNVGPGSFFSTNLGVSAYTQSGGTAEIDGTLTAGSSTISGGILEGVGTVNNQVTVQTGGELKPGDNLTTGTLTVNGTYSQTAAGKMLIQIAALNAFDVLNVNGQANLAGNVAFGALNGFRVTAGETFIFLDYQSLAGTFGSIDVSGLNLAPGLMASVIYGYNGGNDAALSITGPTSATPEPATGLLFAGGIAILAGVRQVRRRRS